ncbi:MAG: helix-turn-helix transcriptional regulator [Chitinophagaceae bacterium]|nr:helix-turn-helix transcriptional regulator [Chitinophagaceae bacterium]MBN8666445.1 helix-turn-helix transcriptional regulator [Chitinophagales bacterium]
MPDVIIDKQIFYNPVDYALKKIGGTWKMPVLWRLKDRSLRYSELQNQIPHISQKMLTQALKQLETDGFLQKKVFAEVPPRTEYALTEKGKKAITVIQFLREYGLELMTEAGIDYGELMKKESQKEK